MYLLSKPNVNSRLCAGCEKNFLRIAVTVITIATLTGCALSVDKLIEKNDLRRSILSADTYRHVVLLPTSLSGGSRLNVYIGGDGIPWDDGRRPSADPTPKNALTIKLMILDDTDAVFIGRPCYFGLVENEECSAADWTSGRYAEKIVASMTSVINQLATEGGYEEIVLIGYSGGGALARLIAPEASRVVGLFTIAGNLDTAEWTSARGFLPLTGSVNPGASPPLSASILHVQAIGQRDSIVPKSVTDSYAANNSNLVVWTFSDFDHACCWGEEWSSMLGRFESLLSESRNNDWPMER